MQVFRTHLGLDSIIGGMITFEEIRKVANSLNGVEETLHFRLPTFKVGGKGFITIQKDAAILSVPQTLSEALAESDADKYVTVWRNERTFVGLKVDLRKAKIDELKPLIEEAYRNRK